MNAIILAAGKGTRLAPLTNFKPKCLVNLFGKSILERQIEIFQDCGINDITVVTGYKSECINIPKIEKIQNNNFEVSNMLESFSCAFNRLKTSTIVSYGDIIFERSILKKLIKSNDDISVVIDKKWERYWKMRFTEPLSDAESLKLDVHSYITSIGQSVEKLSEIDGQYIGLMKFQNKAIPKIKRFYEDIKNESKHNPNPLNPKIPFNQSYITDFLHKLIKRDFKVKAIIVNNGWLEVDSLNDYKLYEKLYSTHKIKELIDLNG